MIVPPPEKHRKLRLGKAKANPEVSVTSLMAETTGRRFNDLVPIASSSRSAEKAILISDSSDESDQDDPDLDLDLDHEQARDQNHNGNGADNDAWVGAGEGHRDRDPANEYARRARGILDAVYHESRSSTVQALVLLGVREFGIGESCLCFWGVCKRG